MALAESIIMLLFVKKTPAKNYLGIAVSQEVILKNSAFSSKISAQSLNFLLLFEFLKLSRVFELITYCVKLANDIQTD